MEKVEEKIPMIISEDLIFFFGPNILDMALERWDFSHSESVLVPKRDNINIFVDRDGNSLVIETRKAFYKKTVKMEDCIYCINIETVAANKQSILYDNKSGIWKEIDLDKILSIYQNDLVDTYMSELIPQFELLLAAAKVREKKPRDMYV